jgi:two-component system, OmpR family, response regulator RpaA
MSQQVCLVDDNPEFVAYTTLLLQAEGYRVSSARDGMEALPLISKIGPDLILLDIMMPRLDGWSTLKVLQESEETADIPVIMLTALDGPHSWAKGYALGCTWFCTKPTTDFSELFLVIRRVLEASAKGEGADSTAGGLS